MTLDSKFAAGMREQLVDTAAGTSPLAVRTRRVRLGVRLMLGAGAVGLLTAGALIAASVIPGNHVVTNTGPTITEIHTGSATVDVALSALVPDPNAPNAVQATFVCTSAGSFSVTHPLDADGATELQWECGMGGGNAVGTSVPLAEQRLVDGRVALDVTTEPGTTWTVTLYFVHVETTEWGVNAKGETYGVPNENGTPDLQAAYASNCEVGYIYFTDFFIGGEEPHSIPVYKSDGETVIGEFWLGSNMPFCDEQ